MGNEIVVRSDYWRHQLSVKRRLSIPITNEDLINAYQDELMQISKTIVVACVGFSRNLVEAFEEIQEQIVDVFSNTKESLFNLVEELGRLGIDPKEPQAEPVPRKMTMNKNIQLENLKLASKPNMKNFNVPKIKQTFRCRNNCRK